jgi:hypothetical protein
MEQKLARIEDRDVEHCTNVQCSGSNSRRPARQVNPTLISQAQVDE